jgi:hypothetical protein
MRIGEKSAELTGDKNFVTTIDMRPEINAIAQVEGTYDEKKGIAKWHISSLDPMTMEPTKYVMDGVLPVNYDGKVEQVDGGPTATVSIETTDDGSGPWRYDVYVQYDSGAWFLAAENVAADTTATVKLYEGIEHHFYCVVTDMAGNVEQKEAATEATLMVGSVAIKGDLNGDGQVTSADVWTLMGIIARGETPAEAPKADVNGDGRIDVGDINSVIAAMAR